MTMPKWNAILFPLLGILLLTGCANDRNEIQMQGVSEAHNRTYIGKHKDMLIRDRGHPTQTMDATITGRASSEAYLYEPVNGGTCIDAFVVTEATGIILDYFCREM